MRAMVRPLLNRPLRKGRFGALHGETGQGLVEYAVIIAIVSLGAVVALGFLSGKINNLFSKSGNSLNNVTVAAGGSGGGPGGSPPTAGAVTITCPGSTGACNVGETATANPGTWGGSPAPTLTYQWSWNEQFSGTPCDMSSSGWNTNQGMGTGTTQVIPNTTSDGNDVDYLRVIVTGTNGSGSVSAVACRDYAD